MPLLTAVHHVQITVQADQAAAARQFYLEVLGLKEISKPQALLARGGFWCELGALQIHIGLETFSVRAESKAHLAYQVDDLAAWRNHLQTQGIVIQDSIQIPGLERFECRDPFGNRMEFLQLL
ncbi:glyoxalase [bacterium (Candidatus Blackallbacteria) CG17_big_fil_post_rev_8_21_14_2_50_48_46]|uniref:Glyoxalase n=1 Tax=bacterium (Candidatus Blackallbacteria) CG17_big_fil_post_rev_8_21_14_2_50_48_46 TaxID=2014261 RepID=A0A2M7FZM8_9BACT|nr:MAG: glyoxalase [bacterium (Candidatus Blackallbacteria) CG18_big_fil_WC_8_21_14_2_50_49_26]PIW14333.1 MAG: glyoxalase [bacterium (Candidatus Blackallbacteria) CG17_big_fil_post_rev_8_21_14_2_50_48_46]PIW45602.1 MAG: glyoxalase [bacterium (Candidatus Blackallbacteria) CG13_big_fil_rev_8_21_14_2_50_49_14]